MRLDALLVEKGLVQSRERARALILSGDVLVNDVPITKAGTTVSTEAEIRLRKEDHPYVSRGALKLLAALDRFKIDVTGCEAMDVGASTGGFTQALLERGAKTVLALDVGKNQLDWKLRSDPRVKAMDGINARNLKFEEIGQAFDVLTFDLSFISLTKVLPAILAFSRPQETNWITLIKPQFELSPKQVEKGGIVRDPSFREEAIENVTRTATTIGLERKGLMPSPILGAKGNEEFLAYWKQK